MRHPVHLLLLLFAVSGSVAWQASQESERAPVALLRELQELLHNGHYDQAWSQLKKGPESDAHVNRLLLELAQREGNQVQSDFYARRLLQLHRSGQLRNSEELAAAAYAAWQLDQWQNANQIFIEASKMDPSSVSMFVDWGNLYLEKYNASEAAAIFQQGIQSEERPDRYLRWGVDAAYVGLAQSLKSQFSPGVDETLTKALELNPENLEALALNGYMALEESDWEKAQNRIDQGLKINPSYLPLLELQCAQHYFKGETDRYQKTQQRILRINTKDGDLFELLGDLAVVRRRLQEAVEFYRQSTDRNPRQWSALASLGINMLRLGEDEKGKRVLEEAYANDPFNIWTVNTLRLLDSFDRFTRLETAHFRVKLHEKEADALQPYVEELLEKSLTSLENKYNHQVTGKYVFEMYPDHDDFAVRTLGLPGLGALGATFGRVVAMDSPSARPRGQFHWGSTLWHELAHVVTLSLSDQKVPRWFSEGLSMMEERQAADGWGEYLNPGFVTAYQNEELLPIADLDSGFLRPKSPQQLSISYFQAGWVCEFLVARYGFDKIRAMLVAYAEELTTEQVFTKVLKASVEEIDGQFQEEVKQTLQPLVSLLQVPEELSLLQSFQEPQEAAQENIEVLKNAHDAHPDNYFLNLRLGSRLRAAGENEEAVPYLEKALQVFPTAAGENSPYDLLIQIYDETDREEETLKVRQQWWEIAPRFVDNGRELAKLLSSRDPEQASRYLQETMYVDPLHPDTHLNLGELYLETERPAEAVREFKIFLSLDPVDEAATHYKIANALLESGDDQGARRHVLLSLEIAPSFEEAQRLLLRVIRR